MQKSDNIRRYTADRIREMRARGDDSTDWARLQAMTPEEVERNGLAQLKEDGIPEDWYKTAQPARTESKKLLSLRLDSDVIEWFKQQGPGYQTRINAVLKAYMKHASG